MGGTFDPIHEGHLAIARSAAEQLELHRVLFLPAGNPHFKLGQHVSSADDRVRMVSLAIEDDPLFELDLHEVERAGVTFTADTLEELTAQNPGAEFYFFLGTDSAQTLPKWRRAETVARLCKPVVLHRPGEITQAVVDALASSPIEFDAIFLDVPQMDLSSTSIRQHVARGHDVDGMVPAAVAQYIAEKNLYAMNPDEGDSK